MQNHLFLVYTSKYSKIYHVVHVTQTQSSSQRTLSCKDHDLKHASHWDHFELRAQNFNLCSQNMALEFRHSQRIQIKAWTGTVWRTQRKFLRWIHLDITLRTEWNDPKRNRSFAGTATEGMGPVVIELHFSFKKITATWTLSTVKSYDIRFSQG